jgi:hypothetical protein
MLTPICWQEKTTPSSILFELFPLFDLEWAKNTISQWIMIGIEIKLNIPVHYQMGNPLQQGKWPGDLYIQSYLPLFWHST